MRAAGGESASPSRSSSGARPRLPAAAWLPLLAGHLGLLAIFDLGAHPWAALGCLAIGFGGLIVASRRWAESSGDAAPGTGIVGTGGVGTTEALILAGAVILRLLLLPLPPTLSEDVLRYVWDGRVVNAGLNPYALPPDAPELATLRDDLWAELPHREVPTVYPPLAQGLFSVAARLPVPVPALKGALVLADLVTCALLLLLARRLGVPPGRTIWYAWSPLVTLEVAGMGHVDALGVAAAVGAVALLVAAPRRGAEAGAAAAAGILVKLAPLAALPLWARHARRPLVLAAVALGLTLLATAPIVLSLGGAPPGLLTYGVSWEFNGPLFEPLWRLLDRLGSREAVEAGLDAVKNWSGRHEFWNRLYPFNYPQLLAKLLLLAAAAAVLPRAWLDRDPVAGSGRVFGLLVVFSATVYPWYLLWVLPFAALRAQVAWRALSGLVLLSYLPQAGELALMPWVYLAIWAPFGVLLARSPRWSTG